MKKLIVVLAHPRTGSSLIMQTLRFLNVGIIGQFDRKDLPQQANPKGYYEDKEILSNGLTDPTIERIEQDSNEALAVKIALNGMMKDDRIGQWQYLQEKHAIILVSIRPPLESAVSRLIFSKRHDEIARFKIITTFLRNYQLEFKTLSKILLTKVPELISTTYTIDYHTAQHVPRKYIQSIIDSTGITVSEPQFKGAMNNIEPDLYRYNQDAFEDNVREWHRKIGSDSFYHILATQKNPWQIIESSLLYGTN